MVFEEWRTTERGSPSGGLRGRIISKSVIMVLEKAPVSKVIFRKKRKGFQDFYKGF